MIRTVFALVLSHLPTYILTLHLRNWEVPWHMVCVLVEALMTSHACIFAFDDG
jgi:hypothetical protein